MAVKLGTTYVNIRANLKPLKAGLKLAKAAVAKGMAKIGAVIKKTGKIITKYLKRAFIAVTGAITASIYAFAKFEKELANVSTMLDDHTMNIMPRYAESLKQLSMSYGESTSTLSKGLYDILSASIAPAKAMNVLTVAVEAAVGGMTNTATVADALTSVMNSYGFSADMARGTSDVLFATVKRGKTTFAELAPSIGKVAALAAVANISFQELGAAIATITRAGLQTDVATTSIKGLILAFLKPVKDAKDMAAKFGFELNTTTLKAIGLTGVLKKLNGATAEQLAVIIPNVRGMAGFAAALKQAEGQASDLKLMLNSTGLTQKAFGKMTNTLSFSLLKLKQAFVIIGVEIGSAFASTFKKEVEKITKWLSENRQEIAKWAELVVNRLNLVKDVLFELVKYIVTDFPSAIKTGMNAVKIIFKGIADSIKTIWKGMLDDIEYLTAVKFRKIFKTMAMRMTALRVGAIPRAGGIEKARTAALARGERYEQEHPIIAKPASILPVLANIWGKVGRDIKKSLPEKVQKPIDEAYQKWLQQEKEIKEKYSKAALAIEAGGGGVPLPSGVGSGVAGAGGGGGGGSKFGLTGLKDMWSKMATGITQDPIIKHQKKTNAELWQIEKDLAKANELNKSLPARIVLEQTRLPGEGVIMGF